MDLYLNKVMTEVEKKSNKRIIMSKRNLKIIIVNLKHIYSIGS